MTQETPSLKPTNSPQTQLSGVSRRVLWGSAGILRNKVFKDQALSTPNSEAKYPYKFCDFGKFLLNWCLWQSLEQQHCRKKLTFNVHLIAKDPLLLYTEVAHNPDYKKGIEICLPSVLVKIWAPATKGYISFPGAKEKESGSGKRGWVELSHFLVQRVPARGLCCSCRPGVTHGLWREAQPAEPALLHSQLQVPWVEPAFLGIWIQPWFLSNWSQF